MKTPTVRILVSIPKPEYFAGCTLCFETLRIGWPTAKIIADINRHGPRTGLRIEAAHKAAFAGKVNEVVLLPETVHHADWIRRCIETHTGDGPLVILDPDTVFWKSCEDWSFIPETLLAGYYVPQMWNDFAKAISVPRIHTSLMVFPDVPALRQLIDRAYPWSGREAGEYCPCDPFMPAVRFLNSQAFFWDTCANLYGMLGSENSHAGAVTFFTPEHLACYNHLNSASFAHVMRERIGPEWVDKFNRGSGFKTLWEITEKYYAAKRAEAFNYL